jgi:hypothetical protein
VRYGSSSQARFHHFGILGIGGDEPSESGVQPYRISAGRTAVGGNVLL